MEDIANQIILGSGYAIFSHPFTYARLLMQVGYDPLPSYRGGNLFSRQLFYASREFTCVKRIAKVHGKAGLFKGLAPSLCAGFIGTIVHNSVVQKCHEADVFKINAREGSLCHEVNETIKETIASSCAIIATHPLRVISLRCMVQFIGKETVYSGVLAPLITVFREEGVQGLFAGLVPRLLGGVLSVWITNLLVHLINKYATDEKQCQTELKCSHFMGGLIAHVCTHPFMLVSNLMIVNNCGLAGGMPPYAPVYPTWLHCWRDLGQKGDMRRGSSLF